MPYKDLQRKQEWEQQHRLQRLTRRRELRRIEAAHQVAEGAATRTAEDTNAPLLWVPIIAGGALASYDPRLAIGVGGLTLLVAALDKKQSGWWIVGAIILAAGFLFTWNRQKADE
jgi:hypothetical protein